MWAKQCFVFLLEQYCGFELRTWPEVDTLEFALSLFFFFFALVIFQEGCHVFAGLIEMKVLLTSFLPRLALNLNPPDHHL
jgi:hypothetical protein